MPRYYYRFFIRAFSIRSPISFFHPDSDDIYLYHVYYIFSLLLLLCFVIIIIMSIFRAGFRLRRLTNVHIIYF